MRKLVLTVATVLFSIASTAQADVAKKAKSDDEPEYVCAYIVSNPGIDILYFAAESDYKSSAEFLAKKTCEYNKGRPFGLEVCEQITCRKN